MKIPKIELSSKTEVMEMLEFIYNSSDITSAPVGSKCSASGRLHYMFYDELHTCDLDEDGNPLKCDDCVLSKHGRPELKKILKRYKIELLKGVNDGT